MAGKKGHRWSQEQIQKNIDNSILKIQSEFPWKYSDDCTLYLNSVEYISDTKKYMCDFYDNLGYRYLQEYYHIHSGMRQGYELCKWFKRNPYTYENIRNFIKINNLRLELLEEKSYSGEARTKLLFFDKKDKCEKYLSWNDLKNGFYRYDYNYEEIKENRKTNRCISKQEAIEIVLRMQKDKNEPLTVYDFYPKKDGCIGIRTVRKFWGELWIMQKELGLKITGKHGTLLSDDEKISEVDNMCDKILHEENRNLITYEDFSSENGCTYSDCRRYREAIKIKYNMSMRQYLEHNGFKLQKAGCGMTYQFEDGEKIESRYEYVFSNILREYEFIFNNTYFRATKYSDLDNQYKGNMNCDYKIIFNNGITLYVELAGILGNPEHIKCYYKNISIKSKSKESYRQKLIEKEEIFKRNNLEYLILTKPDMTEENFKSILEQYMKKVA